MSDLAVLIFIVVMVILGITDIFVWVAAGAKMGKGRIYLLPFVGGWLAMRDKMNLDE